MISTCLHSLDSLQLQLGIATTCTSIANKMLAYKKCTVKLHIKVQKQDKVHTNDKKGRQILMNSAS